MNAQKVMAYAVDPNGQSMVRAGGIAAFILVIGWFLTSALYTGVGFLPTGIETGARLGYYAPHLTEWWAILGLMVFTDFVYLVIMLALYVVLEKVDRNLMLLCVMSKVLFVVLDLAVLWPYKAALFTLASTYTATVTDAQRAALASAAVIPFAVLDSILPTIYSIVLPSLGTLFASLVMLKGVFSKRTAYLGIVTAVTGFIAVADPLMGAFGKMHYINALLAIGWYLLVGWRLYRLGKGHASKLSGRAAGVAAGL